MSEPGWDGADADTNAADRETPSIQQAPHSEEHLPAISATAPRLNRGFDAYTQPSRYASARSLNSNGTVPLSSSNLSPSNPSPSNNTVSLNSLKTPAKQRRRFTLRLPWQKAPPVEPLAKSHPPTNNDTSAFPLPSPPEFAEGGASEGAFGSVDSPQADAVGLLERVRGDRAFGALFAVLLTGVTFTTAWLLGVLAAQVLPGRFERMPIQESFLRKSSRLTTQLWHFSELWQTPTSEVKIEAIPLPETGPIAAPIALSPIERQPLIDELNAIETELITLDRRVAGIEKQLGSPPYQGADLDYRLELLRSVVDPPPERSSGEVFDIEYEPVAREANEALLEVTRLKMTLPSDALFAPGEKDLKQTDLLVQALDQIVNYSGATVSVRSYSDDQVDAIASREYTLAQANELARYLDKALPGDYRWVAVGMGSSQPVALNNDEISRQKNRRIEILVDVR